MKLITRFIKSLVVGCSLLAIGYQAQAATYSTNLTGLRTNIISAVPWTIHSITVAAATLPTGTNVLLNFYDSATDIIYTNAAYTSRTTFSTNVTTIFTNTVGLVQTNIYPGQWTLSITNAAATNTLPADPSIAQTANTSSTLTGNWNFTRGVVVKSMTDVTNVSVIIEYSPSFTNP